MFGMIVLCCFIAFVLSMLVERPYMSIGRDVVRPPHFCTALAKLSAASPSQPMKPIQAIHSYPHRAGHIRNLSRAARPCTI